LQLSLPPAKEKKWIGLLKEVKLLRIFEELSSRTSKTTLASIEKASSEVQLYSDFYFSIVKYPLYQFLFVFPQIHFSRNTTIKF
jgi:hypothetical protein